MTSQPFDVRLRGYFTKVGTVLRGEADAASIFRNPTDIGISRERVYAEFLRLHLPRGCNVSFGGFVFDQDGRESGQIDLIVTSALSLRYDFSSDDDRGKTFACVDGTIAVASLKSTLNSNELKDALSNLATLPEKTPLAGRLSPGLNLPPHEYDDWPFKVIYASDGISLGSLTDTLLDFYKDNPSIPTRCRPNLVHVAGKYSIVRPLSIVPKIDGSRWPAQSFHPHVDTTDVYALAYAVTHIQQVAMAERFMLQSYGRILDKMLVCEDGPPKWVRVR